MGGTCVFFHTLIVVMCSQISSSFAPSRFASQQASVQMWASPACNQWLQDTTICSRMCAAVLLRSPGLQFRAPLDVTERGFPLLFLFPGSHSWAILSGFHWVGFGRAQACSSRTAESSDRAEEGFVIHLNHLVYLPTASLSLFQTNEENTWTAMLENVVFSMILFVSKSDFKMKCEWVIRCQGI